MGTRLVGLALVTGVLWATGCDSGGGSSPKAENKGGAAFKEMPAPAAPNGGGAAPASKPGAGAKAE
jgi:hypothetical protein